MSNNNYYACEDSPRPCSTLPFFTGVSDSVCEQFIIDRNLRLVYAQYGLHNGSILHLRVNKVSNVGSWPEDPPFPSQEEITDAMYITNPSLINSKYAISDASNAAYVFINRRAAHNETDCSDNMTNVWFQELKSYVSSNVYSKWWDIGVDSMGDFYFYEKCSGTYDCPLGTHLTNGHCCPIGQEWDILEGACNPVCYDIKPDDECMHLNSISDNSSSLIPTGIEVSHHAIKYDLCGEKGQTKLCKRFNLTIDIPDHSSSGYYSDEPGSDDPNCPRPPQDDSSATWTENKYIIGSLVIIDPYSRTRTEIDVTQSAENKINQVFTMFTNPNDPLDVNIIILYRLKRNPPNPSLIEITSTITPLCPDIAPCPDSVYYLNTGGGGGGGGGNPPCGSNCCDFMPKNYIAWSDGYGVPKIEAPILFNNSYKK